MRKLTVRLSLLLFFIVMLASCKLASHKTAESQSKDTSRLVNGHPSWSIQSNIYEVNLRQYGNSSSFKGFQQELQRLRDMGVEMLWFMPITPISSKERKGSLGSYYAVQDYNAVNPEYGSFEDWKQLVQKAHSLGFKVLIDWVPNHSGADNRWLQSHPGFYVRDSAGNAVTPYDWTDTRKLNYANRELRDSMIAAMKYWIDSTDVDGL